MTGRSRDLPSAKVAKAPAISRGSVSCLPRPVPAAGLVKMRRIDELHLNYPLEPAGRRGRPDAPRLACEGIKVGRPHAATPMKGMAIEAIYRKPDTSKPALGHSLRIELV